MAQDWSRCCGWRWSSPRSRPRCGSLKRTPLGQAQPPARRARWRCCRCRPAARGDGGGGPGRPPAVAGAGRHAAGHQHAAHDGAAGRRPAAAAHAAATLAPLLQRLRQRMPEPRCALTPRLPGPAAAGRRLAAHGQAAGAAGGRRRHAAAAGRPGAGGTSYSVPIQTLLFFTALLPAGGAAADDGLHAHRHRAVAAAPGLGTQAAPPNQVIMGLSAVPDLLRHGPDLRQGLRPGLQALRRQRDRRSTRR
jgi:hypothetical protein